MYKTMATEKQLKKWRKEAKDNKNRSKMLSKQFGFNICLTDLNPHFTAGRKFPKNALTKKGKRIFNLGHANTRRKCIDIDSRVPKRLQQRVIKHEIEHIKHPRATEKQIEDITFKKYKFRKINDGVKRR